MYTLIAVLRSSVLCKPPYHLSSDDLALLVAARASPAGPKAGFSRALAPTAETEPLHAKEGKNIAKI